VDVLPIGGPGGLPVVAVPFVDVSLVGVTFVGDQLVVPGFDAFPRRLRSVDSRPVGRRTHHVVDLHNGRDQHREQRHRPPADQFGERQQDRDRDCALHEEEAHQPGDPDPPQPQ